ncbi:hypothetical protein DFH11DRAFT_1876747 [Phellopilus nigrolimitatus]|nr:hypothetical protein DFH11DRAFT_1876747 [Phellopilus nigrolimitatus]
MPPGPSSSSGPTPSVPVNGTTAPSGIGAASATDLPPLPANVQLKPSVACARARDPGGPGVDDGGPRVRVALPRDGRAREGGARCDPVISCIMDRSSEFNLVDSASYFFSKVARFGHVGYVPTAVKRAV